MAAAPEAARNPAEAGSRADPESRQDGGAHEDIQEDPAPGDDTLRHPKKPDPEFEHALRLQMAVITGE